MDVFETDLFDVTDEESVESFRSNLSLFLHALMHRYYYISAIIEFVFGMQVGFCIQHKTTALAIFFLQIPPCPFENCDDIRPHIPHFISCTRDCDITDCKTYRAVSQHWMKCQHPLCPVCPWERRILETEVLQKFPAHPLNRAELSFRSVLERNRNRNSEIRTFGTYHTFAHTNKEE